MSKIENISFVFENFYKITHARLSYHDSDFNEIFSFPKTLLPFCNSAQKNKYFAKKCHECDRNAFETVKSTGKTYTYFCHCGLMETVAPIYHFGVLAGYIMMGQVTDREFKSKENIRKNAAKCFDTGEELSAAVLQIPEIPSDLFPSYINLLTVVSEFFAQSNLVSANTDDRAKNIRNYINLYFSQKLSVNKIASELKCSRATLMNSFKKEYGITVGAYITEKRLECAAEQLKTTAESVKTISLACGFYDQNYFSRVFMKKFRMTPTQYRKSSQE